MNYICDICGTKFDSYGDDTEWWQYMYDHVQIQIKPKNEPNTIHINHYKCCPGCISSVICAIEELKSRYRRNQ